MPMHHAPTLLVLLPVSVTTAIPETVSHAKTMTNVLLALITAMQTPRARTLQVGLSVLVMMAIPATVSHAKTMTNAL